MSNIFHKLLCSFDNLMHFSTKTIDQTNNSRNQGCGVGSPVIRLRLRAISIIRLRFQLRLRLRADSDLQLY